MSLLKRVFDPRQWPSPVVFMVVLLAMVLLSGVIASLSIKLMGSSDAFAAVKQAALPWLFLWRWACYAGLIAAWILAWKPRVVSRLNEDRDGGIAARERLRRLEIFAVAVMACIELYNLIDWLGE